MVFKHYYRTVFWRGLPARSYVLLLLAIFFTFSAIGYIIDLWHGGSLSPGNLAAGVIYAGLIGVGYGHGAMRDWRFVPLTAVVQVIVALFFSADSRAGFSLNGEVSHRLVIDGLGLLLSVVAGYVFFIVFISGEGMRHVRLKTEIQLAREMHAVLVPPVSFRDARFDIYGSSVPTSEVGGDLLDLIATSGSLTCYVADVSGHGVGANLLMGMFKSALRTRLDLGGDLASPISDVNRSLYPLRKPSMFLTVAAVRFFEGPDMELLVAGHLPIMHYRATEDEVALLTTRQLGVGIQEAFQFTSTHASVHPGDCLLLTTDGITEVEDRRGTAFGMQRLEALLREHHNRSSREIYEVIRTEIEHHGEQRDDQTVLVIRLTNPNDLRPRSNVVESGASAS